MSAPPIEDSIFNLYDPEAERPEEKQLLSKAEEVAVGATKGALDLTELLGIIQGIIQAPATYGLLDEEGRQETMLPGEKARISEAFREDIDPSTALMLLSDDDELMPGAMLPGQRQRISQQQEELPETGVLGEIVRRATRSAPGLVAGAPVAGEMFGREMLGLGGRKLAERMGFGETGQTLSDVLFSLAPKPSKMIRGGSKAIPAAEAGKTFTQQELIEGARRMGMSEQEIAPLVREGWFSNLLQKISPRGSTTEKAVARTRAATSRDIFENLAKRPEAAGGLSGKDLVSFKKSMENTLSGLSSKAQKAIEDDYATLLKNGVTGENLMNFWDKVNDYFRELPKLQRLKDPIKKSLRTISPELAGDFEMANTLAKRSREVARRLKPSVTSQLISAGEVGALVNGLYTFNLPLVAKTMAFAGTRKLAEKMTTDPRFINLHKKMVTTINAGQAKAAKQIINQMAGMIQEDSPETAAEIRKMTEEELDQILKMAEQE